MISQTQVRTLIPSMGLGEHLQKPHIFIGATLVSCRFILKPAEWLVTLWLELRLGLASVSSCLVEWRTHGPLVAAGGETAVSQSMCWFVALSCTCRWQWLHVCVCVTTPGCAKGKSVHMAHSMVSVNVRPHYPKVDVGHLDFGQTPGCGRDLP